MNRTKIVARANHQGVLFVSGINGGLDIQYFHNNPSLCVEIPLYEYVEFLRTFIIPNNLTTRAMDFLRTSQSKIKALVEEPANLQSLASMLLVDIGLLTGIEVSFAMHTPRGSSLNVTKYIPTGLPNAMIYEQLPTNLEPIEPMRVFKGGPKSDYRYIDITSSVEDKVLKYLADRQRPVHSHSVRTPYGGTTDYPIAYQVTTAWTVAVYMIATRLFGWPLWTSKLDY